VVCPLHLNAYRWEDGTSTTGAPPVAVYDVQELDGQLVVEV
jgi:nitrite reductase (NADH) small subunit